MDSSNARSAPQKRLRLLWLLDSLGMGGAESLAIPFARKYDRSRYDLVMASLSPRAVNAAEAGIREAGVPVFEVGARSLRDRAAFRRLSDFVREEKIDLIHAHLTYSGIWSAALSRSTRIPSVVSLHVDPAVTREANTSLRHRLSSDARDRLMRFMLNRWSSRAVVVSEALRKAYASGLKSEKLRVVHNGIEVERFARDRAATRAELERVFGIPPTAPLAVTVAVLRKGKGIEVLFDAAQQLSGVHFLLVGDGPMSGELRELAVNKGIADRVHWAGFRSDVETILAGCDLFVHPSLADAFPTVLLEAMAAGLPVIASNVGGVPEIVVPEVTGRLVPPGDSAALAAEIRTLLADRPLRDRMSHAAQEIAKNRFSTEAWLARLDAVYGEVVSPGS